MLERGLSIAKINWKHSLLPHSLVAVMLCIIAPLLMGVKNLDEVQVATITEMYLSFLGVLLLVPLFLPDANLNMRDLLASKHTSLLTVRLIRLFESIVILTVLLALFLLFLKAGNCQFRYGVCFYAALSTCLFQGGMGVLLYSVVDNFVFAYMVPFLYFMLSLGSGKKILGHFVLFGLREELATGGTGDGCKTYLFLTGVFMLLAGVLIRKVTRR